MKTRRCALGGSCIKAFYSSGPGFDQMEADKFIFFTNVNIWSVFFIKDNLSSYYKIQASIRRYPGLELQKALAVSSGERVMSRLYPGRRGPLHRVGGVNTMEGCGRHTGGGKYPGRRGRHPGRRLYPGKRDRHRGGRSYTFRRRPSQRGCTIHQEKGAGTQGEDHTLEDMGQHRGGGPYLKRRSLLQKRTIRKAKGAIIEG